MRAILIDTSAGTLRYESVPDPVPSATEILVRVRAAGLNRADLLARRGAYPRSSGRTIDPFVAGAELAGEVVGVGAAVERWSSGDRVMAQGAGYAELATVEQGLAMSVPDELDWPEAGGLPVAALTMHDALRTNGGLGAGGTVLVHAATSGVGQVGMALAARFEASVILGTSRSAEKLAVLEDFLRPLACEFIPVDTSRDDFAEVARRETGDRGVDVIIDNVGASVLEGNVAAAAIGGRVVQVGRLGGRTATVDLDEVARKRIAIIGVTFRTRTRADRIQVVERFLADVPEPTGLGPRIHATFPLAEAEAAQDALARDAHVGKLVLIP